MELAIYHAELAMASLRIFLIILAILVCIEIMTKSTGKLKKATIFFLIALIPSIFYTIGRMINIEAKFTAGKFLSLTFNTLTTFFILIGLNTMNKLLKDISKEGEIHEKGAEKKREIDFLISAAKRFKKWALLQKDPKFSGSRAIFINWLSKGGYGKSEKEICKKLGITKNDFTNIFNKYEKV